MDLRIFKYIGLGLVGLVGLSTAIYFGVTSRSEQDAKINEINAYEEDPEYQFLYKLAQKVFPYLKGRNPTARSGTKPVIQNDLISWLSEEFSLENLNEDNWQNFKSLCEAQKLNENKTPAESDGSDNVKVPASRVCYLDKGQGYTVNQSDKYEKGYLGLWTSDNPGYEGFNPSGSWHWSNLTLWEYFRNKYPTASPLDKFDDWYETQTSDNPTNKVSGIKGILG